MGATENAGFNAKVQCTGGNISMVVSLSATVLAPCTLSDDRSRVRAQQ